MNITQHKDRNFIVMVKISEEWCHIFQVFLVLLLVEHLLKKTWVDSISGLDTFLTNTWHTSALICEILG